jgi:hypothetical protein
MSPQRAVLVSGDYAVLQVFRCSALTPVLLRMMRKLMPASSREVAPPLAVGQPGGLMDGRYDRWGSYLEMP